MDGSLQEWLTALLRWVHIIVGIAWVGTSFFFNWLDARIKAPAPPRPGVEKEMWMIHSGGLYQIDKMRVMRPDRPMPLGAEAQATWITGMLLLVLIYYVSASLYLIDRNVADLGVWATIALGLAAIAVGWFVYDALWQTRFAIANQKLAIAISFALLALITFLLHQVMSGRGAFMHVGAMLGTIMWANVRVRILPAQRRIMSETAAGEEPLAEHGESAKRRSLHNNYMTLPVVFTMVAGHFPSTFGHDHNWLLLLAIFLIGATVRHAFNLENHGKAGKWACLGGAGAALVALFLIVSPPRFGTPAGDGLAGGGLAEGEAAALFGQVRVVMARHCVSCHSESPFHEAFEAPPKGIAFDTPSAIRQQAASIKKTVVDSDVMPMGNETGMSEEDRALVARWIESGAPIR